MKTIAEYRLRNRSEETWRVEQWLREFAEEANLSPAAQNAFDVSLVEWLTNVISYAYEDQEEHWIKVRFLAREGEGRVEIEDDGRAFNPLSQAVGVDVRAPLEARHPGGLGIYLIRQFMDAVEYRRASGGNLLILTRRTG